MGHQVAKKRSTVFGTVPVAALLPSLFSAKVTFLLMLPYIYHAAAKIRNTVHNNSHIGMPSIRVLSPEIIKIYNEERNKKKR